MQTNRREDDEVLALMRSDGLEVSKELYDDANAVIVVADKIPRTDLERTIALY